jgi:hypothetical protein
MKGKLTMATARGTKNKRVALAEEKAVLDSVKDLKLDSVLSEISTLQSGLQSSLAGVSAAMTGKIQQLEKVEEAIQLKEGRLNELFQIEAEAVSLDDIKAQKAAEVAEWDQVKEERRTEWSEEVALRDKQWKREQEQHDYDIAQSRRRVSDEFNAEVARNKRTEEVRHQQLLQEWTERETALKSKENEFTVLKEQVAGFETRLKTDVARAEAILKNALQRQHEHETAMLRKDMESERSLNLTKVSALNDLVEGLQSQIRDLQLQLTSARQDAKEIASSALESASGRRVSEALQRVVETRDPSMNKTK